MAQLRRERNYEHVYNADGDDTEEFVATGNVEIVTNRYRTLATRQLEGGEGLQFGDGQSKRTDKAEGFFNGQIHSGTGQEHGTYRLTLRTKGGQLVDVIGTANSKKTNQTRTDLPDGQAFPVQSVDGNRYAGGGRKGYEIHLEFKASNTNGGFTWDYANASNSIQIDGQRVYE